MSKLSLSESIAKVDDELADKLDAYQKEFEGFEAYKVKSAAELDEKIKQMVDEFSAKIIKEEAELAEKLQVNDAKARADADAAKQAIYDEFDAKQKALVEAEQAAQVEAAAELSTEALNAKEMSQMTAEEIAADYKKTEVVAVAKHLGLKSSGKELDVATRIVEHFAA